MHSAIPNVAFSITTRDITFRPLNVTKLGGQLTESHCLYVHRYVHLLT